MEFKFQITKKELIAFHIKYVLKTKFYKKYGIALQLATYISFLILLTSLSKNIKQYIISSLPIIISMIFHKLIFIFSEKCTLFIKYSNNKFSSKFNPTYIVIKNNNLTYEVDNNEISFSLVSITNFFIDENYIYILTNTNDQLVIPIRCLYSKEDLMIFSNYILENANESLENHYPDDIEMIYL